LCRIKGRRERHRGRDHRVLPQPYVGLQDAEGRGVRAYSEDFNGKNPEIHAAHSGRFGKGDLGVRVLRWLPRYQLKRIVWRSNPALVEGQWEIRAATRSDAGPSCWQAAGRWPSPCW